MALARQVLSWLRISIKERFVAISLLGPIKLLIDMRAPPFDTSTMLTADEENYLRRRKPKLLRTDKGSEFKNRYVRAFLKKEGVHIFYTQNETKSSFAERSIQNLKNRLYRMFTERQSYEYIKELPDIVKSINDTPSRPLGNVAPSSVHKNNEDEIRLNAYLMSRRIVLRSKDSINFYPDIECYSFRVHLPRPLLLDGNWSLSLLELTFQGQQPADPEFYVHCNLCSDTIVGDREVPLLRYMFMDTPVYLKIQFVSDELDEAVLGVEAIEAGVEVIEAGAGIEAIEAGVESKAKAEVEAI
ncbi:hypothetical protein KUTeg_017221 [Tegillarca granosa]|uniref:Integrase catalytic domain-containing protein n=1 Tax=Tegillarca granosa TaxID=220873 RepID=A0ABQ9EIX0_TEGGR|nr:hypothetical protein KUTeg_017221 [Tegillarca granosa]